MSDFQKEQLIKGLEYLLKDYDTPNKTDIVKRYKEYILEISKGNRVV